MFEIFRAFPESIGIKNLDFNGEEENFIKSFELKNNLDLMQYEKINKTFVSDKYVLEKNKILKQKLLDCVNFFLQKELGFDFNVKITTSWITMTLPDGFSHPHHHSLSFFSGVYYPCIKPNLYYLEFLKKDEDFFNFSKLVKHNNYFYDSVKFSLKPNTLVLFNSKLKHRIPKNETTDVRYSLAFNTMPVGLIGNKDSDSQNNFL